MSRKTNVKASGNNTKLVLEPQFKDTTITKFINCLMYSGQKSVAEKIIYDAFYLIKKETNLNPMQVFQGALHNVSPLVKVKSIRVAGSNYQVPVEIAPQKQTSYGIKWIIESARKRSERTMSIKLFRELVDAYNNSGGSIQKKESLHKIAESNRAFAHYRW
jgi:small subunit ribosomal protein S7